jgi:hypothetical protein
MRPKPQASTPNWSATSTASNAIVAGINKDLIDRVFKNLESGRA